MQWSEVETVFQRTMREVERVRQKNSDLSRQWAESNAQQQVKREHVKHLQKQVVSTHKNTETGVAKLQQRVAAMDWEVGTAAGECEKMERILVEIDAQCTDQAEQNSIVMRALDSFRAERDAFAGQLDQLLERVKHQSDAFGEELRKMDVELDAVKRDNAVMQRALALGGGGGSGGGVVTSPSALIGGAYQSYHPTSAQPYSSR